MWLQISASSADLIVRCTPEQGSYTMTQIFGFLLLLFMLYSHEYVSVT